MVSENKLLRKIFAFQKDVVAEGWEKLHNEEIQNL
jgi:hypothetical protein